MTFPSSFYHQVILLGEELGHFQGPSSLAIACYDLSQRRICDATQPVREETPRWARACGSLPDIPYHPAVGEAKFGSIPLSVVMVFLLSSSAQGDERTVRCTAKNDV